MNNYEKIPLLRLFLPFIAGIFFAHYFQFQLWISFSGFLIFMLLFSINHLFIDRDEKKEFKYRWLGGVFLNISILSAGFFLVHNNDLVNNPRHFSTQDFYGKTVLMQVDESPSKRKNAIKATLSVIALKSENKWISVNGKVIQYFEKDSNALHLKYGDRLIQAANFTEVLPPQNPHEFNYKGYLANSNIYHQSFVKGNEWKKIDENCGNALMRSGFSARNYLLKKIESLGISGKEFGLVTALLLGISDYLDADTLKSFSSTGTIHVLSVSGLHVGIFYIIISFLLAFLDRYKNGRFIKAFLIILSIMFYAIITGMAPSVLRAAVMFSVIVIAKSINRNSSIYNTLIFSALVLIIVDPCIVTKIGFLLSYLAVMGIVYLYPKFYALLKIKNTLLKSLWTLVCVSLAAQIATSPLAVYYFNQFPNYFLISNIIVVPLTSFIVYLGIAMLAFSFIPYVSDIFAILLTYLLKFLNIIVNFIENLPFASGINVINWFQMLLLYGFIVFVILYFENLKTYFLKLAFAFLIVLILISSLNSIKSRSQQEFTVYSVEEGIAIDFISGNKVLFITDSSIAKNQNLTDNFAKNNRRFHGVKNVTTVLVNKIKSTDSLYFNDTYIFKNFIVFGNSLIGFINKNEHYHSSDKPLVANYLIVTGLPSKESDDFNLVFNSNNIVLPKNLRQYEIKWVNKKFANDKKRLYNIRESGAYIVN